MSGETDPDDHRPAMDWFFPSSFEDPEAARIVRRAFEDGGLQAARIAFLTMQWTREEGTMMPPLRRRKGDPRRPLTGRFSLRMPGHLHEKLAQIAKSQGMSMNTYIVHALIDRVHGAWRGDDF